MPDDAFLDAAVRAFDDNAELQVIARRELEEALHHAPDRGEPLDALARRFDSVPRRRSRLVLAAVAVVSLALTAWTVAGLFAQRDEFLWLRGMMAWDFHEIPADTITRGLSPQDRLLLMGDPGASPGDRMKLLWQSDPANPAYLAEHARWQVKEEKTLPPELLAEALRLEPDNGYMHYLAAIAEAPGAVESVDVPRKRGQPRPLETYEIRDETKWRKTLDHLHAAAMAPRFEGFETQLLKQRLPLLPATDDILSLSPKCHYLFGNSIVNVHGLQFYEVICAQAQECLKQGDRGGLLKLAESWDRVVGRLMDNGRPTLMTVIILRSNARTPLDHFIAAAEGLELPDMAERLRERKEQLSSDHSPFRRAMNFEEGKRQASLYGSLFKQTTFPLEMPREEDLRPGRLAEYALMDRVAAIAGWGVLVVAAAVAALYRFRGSALVRRLSGRLAELAAPRDLVRVAAAGVVLPFLLALAVIHFTPLGGRAWSLSSQGGSILGGQLAAVLLVMLLLPPVIARGLLDRRAGRVGLTAGRPIAGWLAVTAAAAALPVFGMAQWVMIPEPLMAGGDFLSGRAMIELDPDRASDPGNRWLWAGIGLLAIAILLGIAGLVRSIFTRRSHLLRRLVQARLVFPSYLAGTLLFALAMPAYHAVERHWFARDATLTFLPENWGLTPAEAELVRQEVAQIREVLEESR